MAPSTLGTFLRSFTFGHVRQLDRVLAESIRRAWSAGAGPGAERLVIDIDSFIGEVHGYDKQGAGFGYTGERGYHPLVATRSGSGEALHVRLRKGQASSGRGALRFVQELIARVRRAGASGEILVRADSAFWNKKVCRYLDRHGCRYSIGVTLHKPVLERIANIPDDAWEPVEDYPDTGICQVAETSLGGDRLIVRRVHLHAQEQQTELFAYRRYFAFITNRTDDTRLVDREHRQHAEVELAIRDLKDQALAHFPSGRFAGQLRLDGDRRARAQPPTLDRPARAQRPHPTYGPDDPPLAARDPRPPHPHRTQVDTSPARPLALAARLHRGADPHPGTTRRRLTPRSVPRAAAETALDPSCSPPSRPPPNAPPTRAAAAPRADAASDPNRSHPNHRKRLITDRETVDRGLDKAKRSAASRARDTCPSSLRAPPADQRDARSHVGNRSAE
jgi:hypothetical protein